MLCTDASTKYFPDANQKTDKQLKETFGIIHVNGAYIKYWQVESTFFYNWDDVHYFNKQNYF